MDVALEKQIIEQVRQYVTQSLPLSSLSDEELENAIEQAVDRQLGKVIVRPKRKLRLCSISIALSEGWGCWIIF